MAVYDTNVFHTIKDCFIYSGDESLELCMLQLSTGLVVSVEMMPTTKRGNPTLMNIRIKSLKN
jgi:hypothetical protein